MNRTLVCHYYQAGYCRNGDSCPFVHPTVRCRSFTSTGWCPYGYNCHFWHDNAKKPSAPNLARKPCQFYINNQCKYGDRCSFSHDLSNEDKTTRTLAEFRATQKLAELTLQTRTSSTERCSFENQQSIPSIENQKLNHLRSSSVHSKNSGMRQMPAQGDSSSRNTRPVFIRPRNSASGAPLDGVTKSEICRLQHLEVERFLKSYSSEKLREVQTVEGGRVFHLKFSSTDPDWAYDVHEVILNIYIDKMYPVVPLQVTVLDKDSLPEVLVEHLNIAMSSWIRHKHQQFTLINRVELYMRPLLQWLDRNLENLFTQGLRKYKAQLEEEELKSSETKVSSDVITLSPSNSLTDPAASNSSFTINNVASLRETAAPVAFYSEVDNEANHSLNEFSETSDPDSGDETDQTDVETATAKHQNDDGDSNGYVKEDDEVGEWIEPVVPNSRSVGDVPDALCDNKKGSSIPNQVANLPQQTDDKTPGSGLKKPIPVCGTTQTLYLTDLRLCGKAGTCTPRRLTCVLHCIRCRLPFSWCFNFHGQPRTDATLNMSQLRSLPPHSVTCARCKQSMEFLFEGMITHAFDNRMGTLHLTGCVADDIPPRQSDVFIFCTGCNRNVRFNDLEPGRQQMRHCLECHALIGLEFSGFRLEMPKGMIANELLGTSQSKTFGESVTKELSRKIRRALNSSQNPILQDGAPLPDYGTCKHYRKSYRWLRFPCCGRLEPCDTCHDLNATDGHEMEFANRMVCGFCSKEQPFSAVKPCVRCGKNLSGSRTAHWEGGKGCRNKMTMSRKDSKKYSQLTKTVPKKKDKK